MAAFGSANGRSHPFTTDEDLIIREGRMAGQTWSQIGDRLGRRGTSVCNRLRLLEQKEAHPKEKEIDGQAHRKCGTCRKFKPRDSFPAEGSRPKSYCRDCKNEAHKRWREANRERYLTHTRGYYLRHKEKYSADAKIYNQNNKERRAAGAREWRRKNPDKVRSYWQTRRARKLAAFVEVVTLTNLIERDGSICGICKLPVARDDASIDHVIPLAKGGKHSYANTQLAHLVCNKRKGKS